MIGRIGLHSFMRLFLDFIGYNVLGFVYSVVLFWSYPTLHYWVSFHAFRYENFEYSEALIGFVLAWIVVLASSFVKHPIYRFFNSAFAFSVFIPSLVLFPYFNSSLLYDGSVSLIFFSSVLLSFLGLIAGSHTTVRPPISLTMKEYTVLVGATSLVATALILFIFRNIFSIASIADVYYQRAIYSDNKNIFSYLIHWQMMVFSPFCIFLGTTRNNLTLIGLGFLGVVAVYGITAFKAAPAIAALVYLLAQFRIFETVFRFRIVVPFAFLTIFCGIFYYDLLIADFPLLSYYILDRSFVGTGIMQLMTLEHFRNLPNALWGGSFLSFLFEDIYGEDPFLLLGQSFFGTEVRANSGFFADGFINFGSAGILIMTVLSAITLLITSILLNRFPLRFMFLVLPYAFGFINGPLQVTLLTNGLMLFWAFVLLYPTRSDEVLR